MFNAVRAITRAVRFRSRFKSIERNAIRTIPNGVEIQAGSLFIALNGQGADFSGSIVIIPRAKNHRSTA